MSALELPVLLLNQNYEALNICNVRRAVVLLGVGKAEMLENGRGELHTTQTIFDIPSVICYSSSSSLGLIISMVSVP